MLSILILIGLVIAFSFVVDADFITFFYHLYRTKYKKKCFKGKTLWIVGASSGLGEYLVYESALNDAKCIIISSRRKDQLQRVAKTANKEFNNNTKIIIVPFDIVEFVENKNGRKKCQEFINKIIKQNNINDIDILVMNTGVTGRGLLINTDLNIFKRLMNVNVFGITVFVQSFISILRELKWIKKSNTNKQRGIYVTSSIAGLVGSPGQGAYACAKHAINGCMKSLRFELIKDNIHVGLICPGPFRPSANSNDGLGETIDGSSGRLLKKDSMKKKMTSERAAKLYVTVIACRITESWLAHNPYLLFVYVMQYLPCLTSILTKYVGRSRMKDVLHKQQQKKKE
eukprot:475290_1